ncbi:hypothetical protein [Agromyces neolithicus]|uniref:Aminoglycoside phosphotransferase domain-containing protein n=1 Tax=Agromyces neolithicus TaxID=269420 RepID=A0ABN2LUE9_9MICO
MADAPPPDFHVDAELAARLVSSQHPDLAAPLTLVANGWDNAIFRLGDDLAVRLPRRVLAVAKPRTTRIEACRSCSVTTRCAPGWPVGE